MQQGINPSVNLHTLTLPLVHRLQENASALGLGVLTGELGCTIIDAGIAYQGSIQAGLHIAEICLGGLATVSLTPADTSSAYPLIHVSCAEPVLACLGVQYAGWQLSHNNFFAMGSGVARCVAQKEALFDDIQHQEKVSETCLVLETSDYPPKEIITEIATACDIEPHQLTLILTPTQSLAGMTQIVARSLQTALHKAYLLGYPLEQIIEGKAYAPLPPVTESHLLAMGRVNDAILFAGMAHFSVVSTDENAKYLATQLPSLTSPDYGRLFIHLFAEYEYNFFQVDPYLFSPAKISILSLNSGNSFHSGAFREDLITHSFNYVA